MVHVYFVRHGQTDWNLQRKWQGWEDIPLNAEGQRQAHVKSLQMPKMDLVLASPLVRARETANILVGHDEIEFFEQLKEINLGDAEGVAMEDIPRLFGENTINMWKDFGPQGMLYGFPNGENKLQLEQRVRDFLGHLENRATQIHQANQLKNILVVTHGVWLRSLLWVANKEIPERIENLAAYTGEFSLEHGLKQLKVFGNPVDP